MVTVASSPQRVSHVLERLNHFLGAFACAPMHRLDMVAESACDLVANVLQYRTVLLHVDDGNDCRCTLKKCSRDSYSIPDDFDNRLLQFVRSTVHYPTVLDIEEVRASLGVQGGRVPAVGGSAMAAPIRSGQDEKNAVLGHLVTWRPFGTHLPEVDVPVLNILAELTAAAFRNCKAGDRMTRLNSRLLSEIRMHRRLERAIRESEERYRTVAEHTHDWEAWIAPDGAFLYSSPACERISGHPAEAFLLDPSLLERIIHQDDLAVWKRAMMDGSMLQCPCVEFRIVRGDGHARWVSQATARVRRADGRDLGLRLSFHDITDHKFTEFQLQAESMHDTLTGLANRTLCLNRAGQALERSRRRDGYTFAIISIGLDRFKFINDCLGEDQGDRLVVEIARRLLGCVRRLDTVSRLSGDEFVLLMEEISSPREAVRACKRIRAALARPFNLDGYELNVSASLGVVISPTGAGNAQKLFQNAGIAMRRAKEMGRSRLKAFNSRMIEQHRRRLVLENELRRAVARGEFHLVYQPIISLQGAQFNGFEALVRWEHPERGTVSPAEFIPLAEETGIIVDLGAWVLEEACRTTAAWLTGLDQATPFTVSVNLSNRQLAQPNLVDLVRAVIERTGLPPERLKLEITETAIMGDANAAIEKLNRLRSMGIRLSLDDFGVGYSSMSYLQNFPLDNLKIDLSFVRRLHEDPENVEIVRAIISLAHSLGLEVVAEGVEESSQEDILSSLNCEFGQGFLFARPMCAEEARQSIPLYVGGNTATQ